MSIEEIVLKNWPEKFWKVANEFELLNSIYQIHCNFEDPEWDLRYVVVLGIAEPTVSTNCIIEGVVDTHTNPDENYSIFVVENLKNHQKACFLFKESEGFSNKYPEMVQNDFPVFDKLSEGVYDKTNWLLENLWDEQIEVYPVAFSKPYNFLSFFPDSITQMNDLCVEQLKVGDIKKFSDNYQKIKNIIIR